MSKEKKLLIAIIIFAAIVPISIGLSSISDGFVTLMFFSGLSALLGVTAYLDLRNGKNPNLILMGIFMMIFGFCFLCALDSHQIFGKLLSALYGFAGVAIFVKGIKDWRKAKRNRAPKEKKPLNKKIYIGIGLLVGGYAAALLLFSINPLLMGIGHVMVIAGFICLFRGIAERKNGVAKPVTPVINPIPVKMEVCPRCRKNLAHLSDSEIFEIDGVKYCADCKTAIEQDMKNQHTICSVCGVDLPIENMHIIDDALLCHSCFLKKYGDIDSYE